MVSGAERTCSFKVKIFTKWSSSFVYNGSRKLLLFSDEVESLSGTLTDDEKKVPSAELFDAIADFFTEHEVTTEELKRRWF